MLDTDLAELFGVVRELQIINYVKRLNSPSTYFIHCDFVDNAQNLLNGKPSTVSKKNIVFGLRVEVGFERVNSGFASVFILANFIIEKLTPKFLREVRDI